MIVVENITKRANVNLAGHRKDRTEVKMRFVSCAMHL